MSALASSMRSARRSSGVHREPHYADHLLFFAYHLVAHHHRVVLADDLAEIPRGRWVVAHATAGDQKHLLPGE